MAAASSTGSARPPGRCRAARRRSALAVVRMLALGADFVLLGRAWAYALAAAGQQGVAHVLRLVEAEMRVAMALTGTTKISEISEETLDRG